MTRVRRDRSNPEAIIRTLDDYRTVLGGYHVDRNLVHAFRTQLEPQLADVWTPDELSSYCHAVWAFGQRVHESLRRWAQVYCTG